jgi:phosphate transport system permease protein
MTSSNRSSSSPSRHDAGLGTAAAIAALVSSAICVLIIGFLLKESWPALSRIGAARFLSDPAWRPTEELFGLAPMLSASLAASAGAILVATPLGVASAIFCRHYASPAIARIHHWSMVLLSGVPSVVIGLWGLTAIVPLIGRFEPPGASLLAGILILTLMIAPTIALTTGAALDLVPDAYWRGAAALGLSREGTLAHVLLPAARGGVAAGILLAAVRALGETMAIVMVSGNVVQTPVSLFDPVRTLTANIALEMAYATGSHRASLFVSGLVLTALVLALAAAAWRLSGDRGHA